MLKEHCSVNDNIGDNVFVGIEVTSEDYKITFPLGYALAEEDKDIRKDILLLLSVLKSNTDKEESKVLSVKTDKYQDTDEPICAYMYVIQDFFCRGYYCEKEIVYSNSRKGKINWNRTIKQIKPIVQGTDILYLNFITLKNTVNEDTVLTLIHRYCVYVAFKKMGWLFSPCIPEKPKLVFNKKLFVTVLMKKLSNTFNDQNRTLFRNLLAIIEANNNNGDKYNYRYGTTIFSAVWEKMINRVYGIDDLSKYYPHATWNVGNGDETICEDDKVVSSKLRPDSIMIPANQKERKVYVLDAKYYKYGDLRFRDNNDKICYMKSPSAKRLPHSADINKQITYGEYIAEIEDAEHGEKHPIVYNAFLMPFDANLDYWKNKKQMEQFKNEPSHLHWIGEAKGNWRHNTKSYEKIQGVLLDVKHIMMINARQEQSEIIQLAELIEERCNKVPH